jgi:hypothetical protein
MLEKAGYQAEARLRRSATKDGRVIDQVLYAYVVPEAVAPGPAVRPGPSGERTGAELR